MEKTNEANGLTRDLRGRIISAEHLTRRVTRYEPDGSLTVDGYRHAYWLLCDSESDFAINASYWTGPNGTEQISVPNQGPSGSGWLFNVMNTTPDGHEIDFYMNVVCLKTQ